MMEAIAALSLACNVLQVAETSLKVAEVFRQAYKHDSVKENEDAVRLSNNLSSAVGQLQSSMQQPLSNDDAELNDIAQQCLDRAIKLQNMSALNSGSTSSSRRRDKLRRSFRVVRLSLNGEVKDLETEIQTLRKDLDTRVLVSLRSRYDLTSAQQGIAFASLRDDIRNFIHQQTQLQNQQHQRTRDTVRDGTAEISYQMQSMHVSAEDQKARDRIVNSLYFPNMNARKNLISVAHPDTFEWLFKQDMTDVHREASSGASDMPNLLYSFHDWLKRGQRVYWISGKPGSGKSTLINFTARHKLTRKYLQEWNKSQELVIIESYLWNAGAGAQRTYRGVLATLLTQILKRSPSVLDSILHNDSDLVGKLTLMDWSIEELEKWLLHCFTSDDTYFCVFIDGLDEAQVDFTGSTNPILHFIWTAAALTNVKCCVSSRPLRQFEVAFKDCPYLRLQDLNAPDIRRYFDDNAASIFESAGLNVLGDDFEVLRLEFCAKADGVFLWACLAVGSLKSGVENCDDFRELRQRLEALPSELEDLYSHMWERENRTVRLYQEEASLFFNISLMTAEDFDLEAPFSLSPLHMVFSRPSSHRLTCEALTGKVSEDLEQACKGIQAQIVSRCAGLLEVVPAEASRSAVKVNFRQRFPALHDAYHKKIAFVHRTARDFLLTSTLGRSVCSSSEHTDFQLRQLVCRARLCAIMIASATPRPSDLRNLMTFTLRDRPLSSEETVVLVNDIEESFRKRVLSSQRHLDKNSWFTFSPVPSIDDLGESFTYDFLGATLIATTHWSVKDKLEHFVQDCNPAYLIYLMFCFLMGMDTCVPDWYTEVDTLLDALWNHTYFSKELLRHVAFVQFTHYEARHIAFSFRICAADIVLGTVRNILRREESFANPVSLALPFLENLLSYPFPQDQEVFLTGMMNSIPSGLFWWYETTFKARMELGPILKRRYSMSQTFMFILQFRVSTLLRAAIQSVETRFGLTLNHLSRELSRSSPPSPSSGIEVVSIIEIRGVESMALTVGRAESDALLSLFGYDGPSGHAKFSNDLFSNRVLKGIEGSVEKLKDILEHGEQVDGITHMKELGLMKDTDDPEVGQWPPPLWLDGGPQKHSEAQRERNSAAPKDGNDAPKLQDHHPGSTSSLEDGSDEDQFFDTTEDHH